MNPKYAIILVAAILLIGSLASVSAQTTEDADTPHLTCWPQPAVYVWYDTIYFAIGGEQCDRVVLESVKLNGRVAPHDLPVIEGDSVVFQFALKQLLGIYRLRPFRDHDVVQYSVEYDRADGEHMTLFDEFEVYVSIDKDDTQTESTSTTPELFFPDEYGGYISTKSKYLEIHIANEQTDQVILESITLMGKLTPFKSPVIEGDAIVFSDILRRVAGVAHVWPDFWNTPLELLVEYDKLDGEHIQLVDTIHLATYIGAEAPAEITPTLYCWPQPMYIWDLHGTDRVDDLHFVVIANNVEDIVLESIRIQGKIEPDPIASIEGDSLAFSCGLLRFLGASGFRPITGDFECPYTVEYDLVNGEHVVLTDIYDQNIRGDFAASTDETPTTYCWPQPSYYFIDVRGPNRSEVLHFVIKAENVEDIVLESMRLQDKLQPDPMPRIEGDSVVFAYNLSKFIGASGWRPILSELEKPYTVDYDLTTGESVTVEGEFRLIIYEQSDAGDVNQDGIVDKIDVQFLSDYLFNNGPAAEPKELMDIDQNGRIDLSDLRALSSVVR